MDAEFEECMSTGSKGKNTKEVTRVNVSENNSTTDSSLFRLEGEYSCVFFGGKACSGKGFHMKTQAA